MKFIALDLETTGLEAERDTIIEIAAIKFENGEIIDTFQTLVNPGRPIPVIASQITGITDEMVENEQPFSEYAENLQTFLGDSPILGQNIKFDIGFLESHGLTLPNPQLDTFILARSIIAKAQSYSLEVLAENLDIPHTDAHRAYDDALASVHLMEKLRLMLLKESDKVLNKIQKFLENQEWSWKDFILESISNKENWAKEIAELKESAISEDEHGQPHQENDEDAQIIPLEGKKITEGYIDPVKYDFSEKTLVALPGTRAYYFPKHSFKLKHNYLIPERFEELLEKSKDETWSEEEVTAIIKLIIWFAHTETYETSELKLYNREFNIVNRINLDEHEEHEIYNTKLRSLDTYNKIYISHSNLLKMATLNLTLDLDVKNLVVLDAVEFEKSLMKSMTTSINVGDGEGKGEMLFGLLGIIFEKFAPENLSFPEIDIDNDISQSQEWKKAMTVAQKLIDEFEPHVPPKLCLLKETLEAPEKFKRSLLQTNEGDMLLRITPKDILNLIHEKIWNTFENVIINDDIVETNKDGFLKRALQLEGFETKKTTDTIPEFSSTPGDPKDPEFPAEAAKKIVQNAKEYDHTLVIFPTNGPISHFVEKVNFELDLQKADREIDQKNILGQGVSGSNGKIINKLDPTGNILFVNFDFALELIEVFKDKGFDNISLMFVKLPFMHPNNPYMKYIEGFFESGYDAYKGYSLPKAKCRIMKLIARYQHEFTNTKAHVLDKKIGS